MFIMGTKIFIRLWTINLMERKTQILNYEWNLKKYTKNLKISFCKFKKSYELNRCIWIPT